MKKINVNFGSDGNLAPIGMPPKRNIKSFAKDDTHFMRSGFAEIERPKFEDGREIEVEARGVVLPVQLRDKDSMEETLDLWDMFGSHREMKPVAVNPNRLIRLCEFHPFVAQVEADASRMEALIF